MTAPLRGIVPILVTPFDRDDAVDRADLARELDFLAERGVAWVGLGFGSEVHRMDAGEVEELCALVAAHAGGALQVLANADLASTRAAVRAVRRLARAGAAAAMVRVGAAGNAGPEALYAALRTVAEEGGLPIVVQDAPGMTGVELAPELLARLLREVRGVAAVKVEPAAPAPKISRVVELLDGAPGTILGGAGGRDFVHELERGAAGTMPGPAFPEAFADIQRRYEAGDGDGARAALARLLPLLVLGDRSMDTFLFVQKHVLQRRGVLSGVRLRRPHEALDEMRLRAEVDALLARLGLDGP